MKRYKYTGTCHPRDLPVGATGVISEHQNPMYLGRLVRLSFDKTKLIIVAGTASSFSVPDLTDGVKLDILDPEEIFLVIGADVYFGAEIYEALAYRKGL